MQRPARPVRFGFGDNSLNTCIILVCLLRTDRRGADASHLRWREIPRQRRCDRILVECRTDTTDTGENAFPIACARGCDRKGEIGIAGAGATRAAESTR